MTLEEGLQMSRAADKAPSTPQQQVAPVLQPSPGLADWLHSRGVSLVFTTYQSARIFFVSASQQPDGTLGKVEHWLSIEGAITELYHVAIVPAPVHAWLWPACKRL